MSAKFPRDQSFDVQFDNIPVVWYPYVGKNFNTSTNRVMVYAHNIPVPPDRYEARMTEWKAKSTWADRIDEYTYCQGDWTNAFRCFIKGAVGLKSNFGEESETSITRAVDSFVERITYLNFIQDLVKSENACALAEQEQIEKSKKINREILRILGITHCICWGAPTYQYVCDMTGFKVLSKNDLGKRGFSSCTVDVGGGKMMQCLRIFHPSMPVGFHPRSGATHSIISHFLATGAPEKQNEAEQG